MGWIDPWVGLDRVKQNGPMDNSVAAVCLTRQRAGLWPVSDDVVEVPRRVALDASSHTPRRPATHHNTSHAQRAVNNGGRGRFYSDFTQSQ